ncbi:phosphodiester glycosidase family protein [Shouchella miscanthi]|uniref:Phosphodiester glycosidase family protein n=1 Tax=Shouchella miscanthi TaxID=2598861 RepID=A0ABU6NV43_9BACI|nr:phosphodiester glycosidase family protein [Shouchella miscanthi]
MTNENSNSVNMLVDSAFYSGVTTEEGRKNGTTYYVTVIEVSEGGTLKHGLANNAQTGETARSFAQRNSNTVTINAGIFHPTQMTLSGVNIVNRRILSDRRTDKARYILAFNDNNQFKVFRPQTTATTIINEGYTNAVTGFIPLIENGAKLPQTVYDDYEHNQNPQPAQIFGQKITGDIVILTVDGRTNFDRGFTSHESAEIMLQEEVAFAFTLDGGGSAQTVVRGAMVNRSIDNNGMTERKVPDFFYIQKPVNGVSAQDLYSLGSDVGRISKRLQEVESMVQRIDEYNRGFIQLRGEEGYKTQGIEVWEGNKRKVKLNLREEFMSLYDYQNDRTVFRVQPDGTISSLKGTLGTFHSQSKAVTDANAISENGRYWIRQTDATNVPAGQTAWMIDHYQLNNDALQIATPFVQSSIGLRKRRKTGGTWTSWINA